MSKWKIVLYLAVALTSTGCGKKIDIAQWKEEVLLFDGRTVIVERKATAYAGGFPNASRGRDISMEFKFEPMGIAWRHEMSRSNLRDPIAFEIINNEAYLVLYVGDRESCQGKPPTQYLAEVIKWVNGRWVDVPLSEFPVDKALLNLSSDYWGHTAKDDAKGLIAWKGKHTGGDDNDTIKTFMERGHRFCDFYQKN